MSDEQLRELERASRSDPLQRERLEAAWLRAGLGWHGEALPISEGPRGGYLRALPQERGVYEWVVDEGLRIQFVYVPGGDVECDAPRCKDNMRRDRFDGYSMRRNVCRACQDTGKCSIAPFYLGRFPITLREFWAYNIDFHREPAPGATRPYHPVTEVSLQDAKSFCEWAGLRLPSQEEWKWAALGAPDQQEVVGGTRCPNCHAEFVAPHDWTATERAVMQPHVSIGLLQGLCRMCGPQSGMALLMEKKARRYPWGDEPPSPERCWSVIRGTGTGRFDVPEGTAPVVVVRDPCPGQTCTKKHDHRGQLVPARPQGASWCGAMDMAGNVWEWVAEGSAHGGSFRNDLNHTPGPTGFGARLGRWDHQQGPDTSADDVGFRVALSAAP